MVDIVNLTGLRITGETISWCVCEKLLDSVTLGGRIYPKHDMLFLVLGGGGVRLNKKKKVSGAPVFIFIKFTTAFTM